MIDTHCHLFSEYYENMDDIIKDIMSHGIKRIIVNGCDMKSDIEILDLVKKYDIVYGAIGFHPTELTDYSDAWISWLEEHINDNKIVAIGEIGLDYHYDDADKNRQVRVFKKQLELAEKYHKPVIIHSRDAIQDTYNLLSNYKVKGSIHCYSGSLEMANEFIKLGFYIGVGGVCTFKNAKTIINVIRNIDTAYILLETDSPYLSPEPYRGKINTPSNLPVIANKIAEIKGLDVGLIVSATSDNACKLFDF